jgi:predicted  nucleic acid-binding Zn-ribbon protein
MSDGDLRTYERVRSRRTPAVTRLDGEACGGCHLPLGIAEVRAIKAGQLVQCSNCDRILVP